MALGTASTGTAISSLSGAAATNAALAALGGGSLAAGGGGVALGTAILGGATLGVGLLVGGIIFSVTGSKLSAKADKAYEQMMENEEKINRICAYLERLQNIAVDFNESLSKIERMYLAYLSNLEDIVQEHHKSKFLPFQLLSSVDYNDFTDEQKEVTGNTCSLVGLLYDMCKVELVKKSANNNELNKINESEIKRVLETTEEKIHEIKGA